MSRYIANADYSEFIGQYNAPSGLSNLFHGFAGFCKNLFQGACSGAMTIVGVLNTIGADLALLPALPLENFVHSALSQMKIGEFVTSDYAGLIEIAIGAALFLTAGNGMARTIGLLGIIIYISLAATGTDFSGLITMGQDLAVKLIPLWEYVQNLMSLAT